MAILKVDTITSADTPTVSITDGLVISGVTTMTQTLNVDAGSSGMIDFGDLSGGYGRLYADSTGTFIGSKSNDPLILRTNHAERLRIDTSGYLGIGDDSPSVAVSIKSTAPKIKFIDSDATGTPESLVDGSGGDIIIDIDKDDEKSSTLFAVKLDGSERVRVTSTGLFGIGNNSPNCRLAVKDTTEFTAYGNLTPSVGDCMLQLYNNPANETALDHATMQWGVNGGTHNRVNTISAVAESASNRKLAFTFCTDSGSNRNERMRITGDGSLVLGSDKAYGTLVSRSAHGTKQFIVQNSTTESGSFDNQTGIWFKGHASEDDERMKGAIVHTCSGDYGVGDLIFCVDGTADNGSASVTNDERFRIVSSGNVTTCKESTFNRVTAGVTMRIGDALNTTRAGGTPLEVNRETNDGALVNFFQANSFEGSISVSGSTVSYNGGHLSRWSQFVGLSTTSKADRPTIYQGTVLSNLDAMCEWPGEENQQLNKTKVSDTVGDKKVAGVFYIWDDDDHETGYVNDFYLAMTGDMVIRVAGSTTVENGDLLESAGDGTAKPQADDIIRSKTIAKITSTTSTATYADGSKAYPCVLMAC